jgi:hypothetical protein
MEDENVVDILKWLFKDETNADLSGILTLNSESEEPIKWNVSCKSIINTYIILLGQTKK